MRVAGQLGMLAALLKRGCQVNAPTNDGWTALHEAAANGHALIVDKLLASGAQASTHHCSLRVTCQCQAAHAMPCHVTASICLALHSHMHVCIHHMMQCNAMLSAVCIVCKCMCISCLPPHAC